MLVGGTSKDHNIGSFTQGLGWMLMPKRKYLSDFLLSFKEISFEKKDSVRLQSLHFFCADFWEVFGSPSVWEMISTSAIAILGGNRSLALNSDFKRMRRSKAAHLLSQPPNAASNKLERIWNNYCTLRDWGRVRSMFNIFLDAALIPTSLGGWILARSLNFKRVTFL